ncbi:hypothetical protein AAVH_21973 [Aphelenchoides avenae]|nr:hypothetical protein AAVH_21973 [Aphelenchus avenae]
MHSVCVVFVVIALAVIRHSEVEALDCRNIRYNVNCNTSPGNCLPWCKTFYWTTGSCLTLPSGWSCPGYASGSKVCYCS